MTPQTPEQAYALLARVGSYVQDAQFLSQLQGLVDSHEKRSRETQRRMSYVQQLLLANADDKKVARLLVLYRTKALTYGPSQLVPDEYEELERAGLVCCKFGVRNHQGLSARYLSMTSDGEAIAAKIQLKLTETSALA